MQVILDYRVEKGVPLGSFPSTLKSFYPLFVGGISKNPASIVFEFKHIDPSCMDHDKINLGGFFRSETEDNNFEKIVCIQIPVQDTAAVMPRRLFPWTPVTKNSL